MGHLLLMQIFTCGHRVSSLCLDTGSLPPPATAEPRAREGPGLPQHLPRPQGPLGSTPGPQRPWGGPNASVAPASLGGTWATAAPRGSPCRAKGSRQLRPLRAPPPGRSDSGVRTTPVPHRTLRHGGAGAGACEPPRLPAPVLGRVALPGCRLQVNPVRCKRKGCWGSGRPQRRTSASPPGRRRLREESRPWPLGPQCPRHAPGQPQLFS